ncbi:unnamed protein product [Schistocephalus solidus]|uniref:Reverse transcriptase domain-containing protein n=1 Tax=Schistocephalus solidus TaxID=70667 RepID=A0A183SM05_SCHSO|nr:unnamed protein product [Schistocephalus solidus]
MQAPTRVSTTTVHDLLFADDCALNTVTEEDMQRRMHLFVAGCANFGLMINTAKTVVMLQPPPSAEYNAPRINVIIKLELIQLRGDLIQAFRMLRGQYCCLSSGDFFELATTTTLRGHPIKQRVTVARLDARRLFSNRAIKAWNALPTDIIMSPSVDTFKRKFDQYSHKRPDRIPDTVVLELTGILSIHAILKQVQLRWSGHLVRMDNEQLPKRLSYEEAATDARRRGRQKQR